MSKQLSQGSVQSVQTSGKRLHSQAFGDEPEDADVAQMQPPPTRSTKIVLNIGQLTKAMHESKQQ